MLGPIPYGIALHGLRLAVPMSRVEIDTTTNQKSKVLDILSYVKLKQLQKMLEFYLNLDYTKLRKDFKNFIPHTFSIRTNLPN